MFQIETIIQIHKIAQKIIDQDLDYLVFAADNQKDYLIKIIDGFNTIVFEFLLPNKFANEFFLHAVNF
jgi:hypothetical protein